MTPLPSGARDARRRWAGSAEGCRQAVHLVSGALTGRRATPGAGITGRRITGHPVALAVPVVAAALLLSACGQASSPSPSPAAVVSPVSTPSDGGTAGSVTPGSFAGTAGSAGTSSIVTPGDGSVTPGSSESSAGTAPAPPIPGTLRVTLYGDSIAWETEDALSADLTATGRATLKHEVFPGTAVCDWLSYMRRDIADSPPQAAILIFRGVNYTPCSHGPNGQRLTGAPLADRYEADTRAAVGLLTSAGVHVYLVRAPVARDDDTPALVGDRFARVAASMPNTTYVDAGSIVEGPDRTFARTLPCLPTETCSKTDAEGAPVMVARSPDGSHLCPVVPRRWAKCPVYSPGAIRFAAEVFEAVRQTQLG